MPPDELADKGAKNWKKKEALAYLDWFLTVNTQRVSHLLAFLGYEPTGDQTKDLPVISELLYDKINNPQFYTLRAIDGAKILNDQGLAIAADMGLLISDLLKKEKPSLHWEIGTGPKSYHSYNLPVLKEFKNGEWDLIFDSIGNIGVSLNVEKKPFNWLERYQFFLQQAI